MTSDHAAAGRGIPLHPSGQDIFVAGRQAEQSGRLEQARRQYESAVATDPGHADWHYRLGCVCLKLEDPVSAENAFRRALDLEPASASTLTNLGVALDRQGRRDEAVRAYRRSLQHGGTAVAHHNLGSIHAEEGRTEEAVRSFAAAIALAPDAEAYLNLGLVHVARGDHAEALACFEQAVTRDPEFALGHYHAALCLKKTGRYAEACRGFARAWSLDARLARVPFHVGTCLHKQERYEEARRSLEQALEFFPDDGRVHYQLALTCDALGLPQEARGHYGRARALGPDGRS
ncbi:MAG: tetratricopeptide repeat protein [Candidatus Krumholzibacteriia bacterium]